MGSQTLEILRQGVWASITGGWFYDPHQNVFCNTAHLYIWLFLLCLPFTFYLYFPPSIVGWCVYCALVSILFGSIKLVNYALHHMYDTSECIIVPPDNTAPPEKRRMQKKNRNDEDFELQVLSGGRMAMSQQSDNESVDSRVFHKPTNSTIDLKVDVHRKNSSESSGEESEGATAQAVVTKVGTVRRAERVTQPSHQQSQETEEASTSQGARRRSRPRTARRWAKHHSGDRQPPGAKTQERRHGSEEALRMELCSKTEDAVAVNIDEYTAEDTQARRGPSTSRGDSNEADFPDAERYLSKFARRLSSDSRDNSEPSVDDFQTSPVERKSSGGPQRQRYFGVYPAESCTKSAVALARPSPAQPQMRRNSNSTMSAIQLPLAGSTARLLAHVRRHSNVTDAGLGFLPTGSVELGAYMLEKADAEAANGKGKADSEARPPGVRRIKSAALEIGCPPPSVSNLSPHPNSAETIGGQVLKNPESAVIPPPSKSLIRNPHLNLWPKGSAEGGDGDSSPYMNYGSEIVYPIAEISDEMQTSQGQESDPESLSSRCDSDYEDEDGDARTLRRQLRGFDSDFDRPLRIDSSDAEYENNGSRSPLLDRGDRLDGVKIVKTKSDKADCDHRRQSEGVARGLSKNGSFSADTKRGDKHKSDRNKRLLKNNSFSATPTVLTEEGVISTIVGDADDRRYEGRLTECSESVPIKSKQKIDKTKSFDPADRFDEASGSSKDFLIEKSSVESDEGLLNFEKNQQKLALELEKEEARKPPDPETSNSSVSPETHDARREATPETSEVSELKTPFDGPSEDLSPAAQKEDSERRLQSDENSFYGITWLFDESNHCTEKVQNVDEEVVKVLVQKPSTSTEPPRNLGAIPKQVKNLTRTRASSLKENKKKDKHKDKERDSEGPTQEELDTVEAHSALVQGLECLFAAANANTVVMPPLGREERPRSHRQAEHNRRDSQKPRKRSIEEMAQTTTNTILPTSMPLLAAFLNSRVDYPHVPIYLPGESEPGPSCSEAADGAHYELQRTRPLMDRNHRNRMRKIKRSTRSKNTDHSHQTDEHKIKDIGKSDSGNAGESSGNVHFATSFEDTTDGAIHCFLNEYGSWMSYTFDKNSSGHAKGAKVWRKLSEVTKGAPESPGPDGSCTSIASDATGPIDSANKVKQGDAADQGVTNGSIYNSSSNQGSNNPLLSSNNSTTMVPVTQTGINLRSKMIYVMEPTTPAAQLRALACNLSESVMERIEMQRMVSPNLQISYLLNSNIPAEPGAPNMLQLSMPPAGSVGDNSLDRDNARKRFRLIDSMEYAGENQPTAYYKFKLFKCWQIKVTMDRLKLMALLDRNLTLRETILSILLGISVSIFGATVLNMGFYKDVYAFWFCFVIAGSQYSLLKSVQPDSASPVHGFNRMVAFSRPVYFCICAALLCTVHYNLESFNADDKGRSKRNADDVSEKFTFYGMDVKTKAVLELTENVISKFLLCFPLAFSLGLFPQVNTFTMYLFEQADMHIFGGNATASLTASMYCVFRSLLAVAVLYGFAYGGLTESKGSQHILFSMFCALVVPISYHLSRCASDYAMVWNLIKNHLIPADLYAVHSANSSNLELETNAVKVTGDKTTPKNKHDSESNISKQPSVGSSTSKINFSSETNISKSQKRSQTSMESSVNSLKMDSNRVNLNSSGSIKMEPTTDEATDQTKTKTLNEEPSENEMEDPLPRKLQNTVNSRFKNDIIVCSFMALFIFGIHCTTVFSTLQPELNPVVWSISGLLGWILHYLMPQLRKQLPWLWLSGPALQAREHTQFEVREPARVMWFEKAYVYLCFIERNLLYPVVFISAVTQDSPGIVVKFGPGIGALIICICALKGVRNAYSDPDNQYLILLFAVLLFRLDYHWASESFLVDYFMMAIIFNKTYEFLLKIQFVVTYIAPWQITWGSAFHAFAQPFSVPHSAMLFLQAAISALLSTPLNPILGSAIFMSSYVRPVKFWERDYNTKRVDQSNTRLSSQLERNLGSDDNNLNSIFYEHLTRSLQHYLCGDLLLGRWGQVQQGDCFVLASDYLNCLVHIVEMGNGLVSFQLRGLEFRGTYCQQREVEAISEGPEDNDGCCCCAVGHLPHMLSVNAMFSLRWLAWQLTTARYVLEGYSISDNSAISMLQVFDFRKVLITYYVKSIIFYTIQSPKLEEWLASASILEALKPTLDRNFIDLDPIFNLNLDEDYDFRASGITRASFCSVYHEWVSHCGMRREDLYKQKGDKLIARESALVSLCFGLSLVGRRSLGAASHNSVSNVEFFLYGLHALFKGDFRITCVRDEWVFSDMSLLHSVLAPAVRMALKLHQDHFMSPEEYCSCPALYSAISCHTACLVICHEASPTWRNNVLRGAPHLLALRHVMDEGNDEYKIIMLNKRYLSFRVIKLNRECVRGLWAGQQQELVYLRNRNPERGSIQNAKQALRNIINSSCDQPIGYPIYVSPLTTSYAETNQQLTSLTGGSLTLSTIKRHALGLWRKMRRRCGEGCSSGSGSGSNAIESGINTNNCHLNQTPHHTLELSRTSLAGTRGSLASVGKPGSSTLVSLAGLLGSREQPLAPAGLQAQVDLPITAAATRLFFERDSETGYATIKEAGESKSIAGSDRDRDSSQRDRERDSETVRSSSSGRSSSWRNNTPANQYTRDTRLCLSIRDRARDGARRSKRDRERDRIRPSSFRLLSALERDNVKPPRPVIQTFEENPNPDWVRYSKEREGKAPSVPKEVRRGDSRGSGAKMSTAASFPTPESSAEDLSYNPGGDSCQIIANRNANMKHSESHKRRSSDFAGASGLDFVCKHHNSEKNIDNIVPKDLTLRNMESSSEHSVFKRSGESPRELTKTSKDLRHDRESYRELTGKYNELSMKETGLRIAGDPKDSVRLPIVKRSESLKAELKNHVSVGCKVVIIDPSGVYDCINLGRRIDVTWPSVYQRHRGGRNHWSTWVPQQGMDGQVVHRWTPNHRDPALRSHVDKTILLVQIGDRFVPIAENCVQDLGDEV